MEEHNNKQVCEMEDAKNEEMLNEEQLNEGFVVDEQTTESTSDLNNRINGGVLNNSIREVTSETSSVNDNNNEEEEVEEDFQGEDNMINYLPDSQPDAMINTFPDSETSSTPTHNQPPYCPRILNPSFTNSTLPIFPERQCECSWRNRDLGRVPPCYVCSSSDLPPSYIQKKNKLKSFQFFKDFISPPPTIVSDECLQSRPVHRPNFTDALSFAPSVEEGVRNASNNGWFFPQSIISPEHRTFSATRARPFARDHVSFDMGRPSEEMAGMSSYPCCGKNMQKIVYSIPLSILVTLLIMGTNLSLLEFLCYSMLLSVLIMYPLFNVLETGLHWWNKHRISPQPLEITNTHGTPQPLEITNTHGTDQTTSISISSNTTDSNSDTPQYSDPPTQETDGVYYISMPHREVTSQ